MNPLVIISGYASGDISPAALIFETIRVGFPTATVEYYWSGNDNFTSKIQELCNINNITLRCMVNRTFNHEIISSVLRSSTNDEVVFLDSDIVFHESVEKFNPTSLLSGRLLLTYKCPYTGLVNTPRLHPSFLWIKSIKQIKFLLRDKLNSPFVPKDYIKPVVVMGNNGQELFFDTCSNLFLKIGGETFTEEMLNKYDHLFCSTFVDEVSKNTPLLKSLSKNHKIIYNNPILSKGMWKQQQQYFDSNSII